MSKKNVDIDLSKWQDYTPHDIPHQQNGYDCGVFMCAYAECVSRDDAFFFSQRDMEVIRKRMCLEILNCSLINGLKKVKNKT